MPGYDQNVYDKRCNAVGSAGHAIASLRKNTLYDNTLKVYVDEIEVLCINCGMSLEEIREQKVKKARTPRQPKALVEAPVA